MITIVNNAQNLQVNDGDDIISFPKETCRITLINNIIEMSDVADETGGTKTLDVSIVSDPQEPNNTLLAQKLIDFLSTGTGASVVSQLQSLDISLSASIDGLTFNAPSSSTAILSDTIVLNDAASSVISVSNSSRKYFHVCNNDSQKGAWVKLQAASVDNDMKGIFLEAKGNKNSHFFLDASIYTGEISAIADTGTPQLTVTTF